MSTNTTPVQNPDDGQDTVDPIGVSARRSTGDNSEDPIIHRSGGYGSVRQSGMLHYNASSGGSHFDPPGGGSSSRGINHVIF